MIRDQRIHSSLRSIAISSQVINNYEKLFYQWLSLNSFWWFGHDHSWTIVLLVVMMNFNHFMQLVMLILVVGRAGPVVPLPIPILGVFIPCCMIPWLPWTILFPSKVITSCSLCWYATDCWLVAYVTSSGSSVNKIGCAQDPALGFAGAGAKHPWNAPG